MKVLFSCHKLSPNLPVLQFLLSTLIDHIYITDSLIPVNSGVLPVALSDHYPVFVIISVKKVSPQSRHVIRRNYNKFNYDKFISDIIHSELLSLVSYTIDLNEAWLTFKAEFLDISNSNAPLQKFTVKSKSNPWISTEILKLIYTITYIKLPLP